MNEIANTDNIIDSRDVIERIEYLKDAWSEATGDDHNDYDLSRDDWSVGLGDDEADELVALLSLADQCEPYVPDWLHGEVLIHDAYFEEYAMEMADDIGAINADAGWPNNCIDWERAARELQMDYTEVDFDGATYWVR